MGCRVLAIRRKARFWLTLFGIDIRKFKASIADFPAYRRDRAELKKQAKTSTNTFPFSKSYPCLAERNVDSGAASGHYFHQDLLVAREIFKRAPERHVDIGSRIDGFVAHVACFREIEVFDIRPLPAKVPNISFVQADLMSPLDSRLVEYCDSLSYLHALEHFGLGRYGDQVNFDGHILGLNNLYKILKPRGRLYLSVPIGKQRIEFNAHRVFSIAYLLELLEGKFTIEKFSYVNDKGDLVEDVDVHSEPASNNFHCKYGCGIFELVKLPETCD